MREVPPSAPQAASILAGGENRRFPLLKSFIRIGGVPIIERNLLILTGLFREVFVSTNAPQEYFHLGVPLVGDVLPSQGPMAGIFSCLINVTAGESIFVAACDMPFLNSDVISLICRRHAEAVARRRVDVTVPLCLGEPQPLCAVYSTSSLPHLEEAVLSGRTSLKRFLNEVVTHFVSESEVRSVDPEGLCFVNINTVEDYEAVAHRRV
jgi:molybdopterin-guanine dinucleotide biosynthesis protein A